MRESYRLQKNTLLQEVIKNQKKIALFFIYTSGELPIFSELYEKLGNTLERVASSVIEN